MRDLLAFLRWIWRGGRLLEPQRREPYRPRPGTYYD